MPNAEEYLRMAREAGIITYTPEGDVPPPAPEPVDLTASISRPAPCNCADCRYERGEMTPQEAREYRGDFDDYDDPWSGDSDAPTYTPYGVECIDDSYEERNTSLLFENLPDRPVRMVSCEQEVGSGARLAAEELYTAGLASQPYILGYHQGEDEGGEVMAHLVRVERDSTVDGELIWSQMYLDEQPTAKAFAKGLRLIQAHVRDEVITLDRRCGWHTWVDAGPSGDRYKALTMDSLASLYHLWNGLEDPIFRLAAANWDWHRGEQDNEYGGPITKGLNSKARIWNAMRNARDGLNFGPVMQARQACRCGATYSGAWEECTCNLYRCAVEFRVFNGVANPLKARAYIALALGLVAYADQNHVTAEEMPEFRWEYSSRNIDPPRAAEALDFILNTLPMEQQDRDALAYCAERSSLAPALDLL